MINTGDKVPTNIKIKDINDSEVTLSKYLGKYLVLYFYPKDETPGCTKEACSFRDVNEDIKALGASIIGISKDNAKSHNKFTKKHELNFDLLSDENHELQDVFGVWGEKTLWGRKYMGTLRTTFLINQDGEVIYKWEKVNPLNHSAEVLEKLREFIN